MLFLCVCRRQLIMIELGHFCDARWLLFVVASLLIPECGSDSGDKGQATVAPGTQASRVFKCVCLVWNLSVLL